MQNKISLDGELIRALDFAYRNPKGFTVEKLAEHLDIKHEEWGDVLKKQFGSPTSPSEKDRLFLNNGPNGQYALSVEGTKMFFDVIEIRDAKEQSKQAKRLAIGSLFLSILVPVAIAIIDQFRPTTIQVENTQFEQMKEAVKTPTSTGSDI